MGRSPYQGEKRRKELARLKKQEEKRQRRFNKKHASSESPEGAQEGAQPEGAGMEGSPDSAPTGMGQAAPVEGSNQEEQGQQTAEMPRDSQEGGQQS